ncbi:MAG: RNA polymerase sigma factor [Bacteroidia bacterium]
MHKDFPSIIEGCIKQNPLAQRRLYEVFAAKMLAVCFRYARDRDEAEDILQEGFIKVFRNIEKYAFNGSLEGWVRKIMVNTAIDTIRKNRSIMLETPINDSITESYAEDAIDNLEVEALMQMIQELPAGYRIVFNLYAIEGYSHAEIGEQLGITESTSRSQYTRAKALLKKRVCEVYWDYKIYQDAI